MYAQPPAPKHNEFPKILIALIIACILGFLVITGIGVAVFLQARNLKPLKVQLKPIIQKKEPADWRKCRLPDMEITVSLPSPPEFYNMKFSGTSGRYVKNWTAYDVNGDAIGIAMERREFRAARSAEAVAKAWADTERDKGATMVSAPLGTGTLYVYHGIQMYKGKPESKWGFIWQNEKELKYFQGMWMRGDQEGLDEWNRFTKSIKDDSGQTFEDVVTLIKEPAAQSR